MINLNQMVQTRWNGSTKQYYENLGYLFTKNNDFFYVKVGDLKEQSSVVVEVECDICHRHTNIPYSNYNRIIKQSGIYRCKACTTSDNDRKRHPKETFFNKFIEFCERNDYIPVSTIDDFLTTKSKLMYICKQHGEKYIAVDDIKEDNVGCRECSYEVIKRKNMLPISRVKEIVEANGNKLLNPDDYTGVKDNNLEVECGICKNVFTTSLESQIYSQGACLQCGIAKVSKSITLKPEYLDELYNSNGKTVLLNPYDYIGNNILNLQFVCSECGSIYITSKSNYDGGYTRCGTCSRRKSSGELIIENYLTKNNIQFIPQHRYSDCKDKKELPFDFYLPDYNTIIEFDGQLHYVPRYGEEKLKNTQYHDEIKNQYCKDNNIKLIRIPYWEGRNIEEILTKELNL